MKRSLRNAPIVDLEKIKANAAAAGKSPVSSSPAVNELISVVSQLKTGNTIDLEICGREVKFTLRTIPAVHVERKTLVWGENERLQELLTETTLEDLIPSFETSGQQNPAFGREVNGLVEIADGSRRRKTAIITGKDYRVLVGDLDEEQMAALSQVGNVYRPTSAYERGRRYQRLLDTKYNGNVSALAEAEKVDRNIVNRCTNTAKLPVDVLRIFDNPNELSARAGNDLYNVYKEHEEDFMARVAEFLMFTNAGQKNETDLILRVLKASGKEVKEAGNKKKVKPTIRSFGDGITARYKGNEVNISLRGVAPEVIRRIEALLEASQKPGESMEVDKIFAQLEEKLTGK